MCVGGRIRGRCINCPPNKPIAAPAPARPAPAKEVIVPLTGVKTEIKIVDFTAEVTIRQRFENVEEDPIEAVYEFPVDPKFSVCAFRAEIDGKVVEGIIKEKQKAKETYDDAIASGHGAYLLEEKEDQPTVFSASVGNLPPGKAVLLTVTYVTELDFEDGKLKYVLPTQPYAPNGRDPTPKFTMHKVKDFTQEIPYGLAVNVSFNMTSNIKSVSSPTHPIDFEFGDSPKNANVKLIIAEQGAPLLKDFIVTTTLVDPHQPCVRIEDAPGGKKAALVALYPKMDEEGDVFTEMIFIVDRSGSMAGSRISSVKDTLQVFLRSIPEGTLFNIIGFGSNTELLFPQSSEYNEKTLATAVAHVDKMTANLGGTNIMKPLTQVLTSTSKPGIPRQLFIMTDGEVTNTQECIDTVRKHAQSTRVFTFGIGNDASKTLVSGMADAGEGKAEFIKPGENMEEKVLRQLKRALKPAFTDITIDFGDQKGIIQVSPYRLPPCFSGQRVCIYAILPSDFKTAPATFKAQTPAGPFTTSITVDPATSKAGKQLYRLAARALLRDLQEKRSFMHGDQFQLIGKYTDSDVKKEMISISIASGVVCSQTAFVAVEQRSEATIGEMKLRKMEVDSKDKEKDKNKHVPLAARHGGGGSRGGAVSASLAAPPQNRDRRRSASPSSASKGNGSSGGGIGGFFGLNKSSSPAPSLPAKPLSARSSSSSSSSSSSMGEGGASHSVSSEKRKKSVQAPVKMMQSKEKGASLSRKKKSSMKEKKVEEEKTQKNVASSSSGSGEESDDEDDSGLKTALAASLSAPAPASAPVSAPMMQQAVASPVPASSQGDLNGLIRQAAANGSFSFAALKSAAGKASAELVKGALPSGMSGEKAELILTTLAVCLLFESIYADKKGNWELVVSKARKWAKKEAANVGAGADWDAGAAKLVASVGF